MNVEYELGFRKAKRVEEVVCFTESDDGSFAVCPTCRGFIECEYVNFCDQCGQKLSWKQFNKAKIIYR